MQLFVKAAIYHTAALRNQLPVAVEIIEENDGKTHASELKCTRYIWLMPD